MRIATVGIGKWQETIHAVDVPKPKEQTFDLGPVDP
jgi:hypothetical protein